MLHGSLAPALATDLAAALATALAADLASGLAGSLFASVLANELIRGLPVFFHPLRANVHRVFGLPRVHADKRWVLGGPNF